MPKLNIQTAAAVLAGALLACVGGAAALQSTMAAPLSAGQPSDQQQQPAALKVGADAPAFELPSSTGQPVKLSDYKRKTLVVYFYPKADTPGCTTEACGFRDSADEYKKAGVSVVGISPDPVEDVKAFAEKYDLNFPLLADADRTVCEKYGVLRERTINGRTVKGAARTTFVVGPDGKITHVFENVKPDGHDDQVLAAIQGN